MDTEVNPSSIYISEEDLSRIKRLVLTALRSSLVQSIDPRTFLPVFIQEFVMNKRDCDHVKAACCKSVQEGTEVMLDILETKGSRGYNVLCEELHKDGTQLHLLRALNEKLTQFTYNFRICTATKLSMEAEIQRNEMEMKKQSQYKDSPFITGQALYLTPDYKRLHQRSSHSPIHSEELPPYRTSSQPIHQVLVHPQSEPQFANGFSQQTGNYGQYQQTSPFGQYQQTFQPMVHVDYPVHCSMAYPGYKYPNMDIQHDPQYDVPCGQQGN